MEKIFHYTSINSLAYILRDKRIKLNRLDHVNDPDEGKTSDWGDLSKFFYVTCWTNNTNENLALWNMYTQNMRGVRIGMDSNFVGKHIVSFKYVKLINSNNIGCYILEEGDVSKVYTFSIFPFMPVNYLKESEFSLPNVHIYKPMDELPHKYDCGKIGITKSDYWGIENELRYRIQFQPLELLNDGKLNHPNAHFVQFDYLFCEINPESYQNMEIRLGPKCDESDYILVKSLLENYNPKAELERSYIRIK